MYALLSLFLIASPVPKQPTELTDSQLIGEWKYEYASMLDGWIRFDGDGTYVAQHYPGSVTRYGEWYVARTGEVVLIEGMARMKYVFALKAVGGGLEGLSNDAIRVRLSGRLRE